MLRLRTSPAVEESREWLKHNKGIPHEQVLAELGITPEEIELLLEAVQTAKYPDRPRAKPALDKFNSLDALRVKIQGETPD